MMDKVHAFLQHALLQHYVSKYYDPVKAHEYYMRTRQLTGRTTRGMSDQQKETWGYTKSQITDEKSKAVKGASATAQQQIKNLRSRTAAMRSNLMLKLRSRSLTTRQKEDLANSLQSAIDGVRESFKNAKEELNAKYEQVYNDEYANVLKTVAGKVKKTSKGKGRGKGTSRSHAPKYE